MYLNLKLAKTLTPPPAAATHTALPLKGNGLNTVVYIAPSALLPTAVNAEQLKWSSLLAHPVIPVLRVVRSCTR